MKRLTIRNSDGSVSQPTNLDWNAALEKLASYEDSELAPEEIKVPVGWSSIKDNLPEASGEYLVYDESGNVYNCEFDDAIGDDGEFGYWEAHYDPDTLGFLDSEWVQNESVTHWMPLPELPEVEDA